MHCIPPSRFERRENDVDVDRAVGRCAPVHGDVDRFLTQPALDPADDLIRSGGAQEIGDIHLEKGVGPAAEHRQCRGARVADLSATIHREHDIREVLDQHLIALLGIGLSLLGGLPALDLAGEVCNSAAQVGRALFDPHLQFVSRHLDCAFGLVQFRDECLHVFGERGQLVIAGQRQTLGHAAGGDATDRRVKRDNPLQDDRVDALLKQPDRERSERGDGDAEK